MILSTALNSKKKVRNGLFAYRDIHGVIYIGDQRYFLYSMTDAIKQFRKNFPAKSHHKKQKNA